MDRDFLRQIDALGELLPLGVNEKLEDDFLICECHCVSVLDIKTSCSASGKVDLEVLQNTLHLGTGCQGCLKRIDSWVHKIF